MHREKKKSDKKIEKRRTKNVFSICTLKKRTSSFFSLTVSVIPLFVLRLFFYAVVFPLHRLFCSVSPSLCVSPFSSAFVVALLWLFSFFLLSLSLSLSLSQCDRLCVLSSSIDRHWCVSRVSNGCQRSVEIATTPILYSVDVPFCSSRSLRRHVRTPFVFKLSRCSRDAFRHIHGFYCNRYYAPLLITVILVKRDRHPIQFNHHNK